MLWDGVRERSQQGAETQLEKGDTQTAKLCQVQKMQLPTALMHEAYTLVSSKCAYLEAGVRGVGGDEAAQQPGESPPKRERRRP
jgi:hypothetical protein